MKVFAVKTRSIPAFFLLFSCIFVKAQVSGIVYKDFNSNGTREITVSYSEPGVAGVHINLYNNSDLLVATTVSSATGSFSFTQSSFPYRVEFLIPASACMVNNLIDFSSSQGEGNNVRFVSAATAALNYALNNPADFTDNTNPKLFVPQYTNGDPLGGGTSATYDWFSSFAYNSSGTAATLQNLNGSTVGSLYGVAFSRQAQKIFVSAFLKRHSGFGILGSGGIYKIDPASFTGSSFYDMDVNGYRTRAAAGCTAYGAGSSFNIAQGPDFTDLGGTITHTQTITYLGAVDASSGSPCGLGVIGTNGSGGRDLPKNRNQHNNDPAAFDQVGKVSLGDMEISDDGRFLFVTNLYDRKIYRLQLNDAYNPTAVLAVTSYNLPAVLVTNGVMRPFGLKFYRDKLFVGAVATGENGGTAANMFGYVFELNDPAGSPAFNALPVLQFPLNYNRGRNTDAVFERWRPWDNILPLQTYNWDTNDPQPVFTGIEFDTDGSMIIGLRDRAGDQLGVNRELMGSKDRMVITAGDILRAYYNTSTCVFEIEQNAKEGISSAKPATAGAGNAQGPGNGEFYYQDNISNNSLNTAMGSMVVLPGKDEVATTIMDPINLYTGGISWMNNMNGTNPRDYQIYSGAGTGSNGKANGLGDIEVMGLEPALEIGNRVWHDADYDGLQDAGESGISSVEMELLNSSGTIIASASTDANGYYYFSSASGTSSANVIYNVPILPNSNYTVRVKGTTNTMFSMIGNAGLAATPYFTFSDITGNGQPDWTDNDGHVVGGVGGTYEASVTTGRYGENNHNMDFGFNNFRVLPLKWIYFKAAVVDDAVKLDWKLETQDNLKEYIVEFSAVGRIFTEIIKVPVSLSNDYSALHVYAPAGINYYRIKAISKDGAVSYSSIQKLNLTGDVKGVKVYPNPARSILKVSLPQDMINKPVVISVLTVDGKLIMVQKSAWAEKEEVFDVSTYSNGKYVLRIESETGFTSKTVQVIH